jgi:type IV pilus assembly protein PilY1
MSHSLKSAFAALVVGLTPLAAHCEDIDLFIGASGGSASAPHVMVLIDNSNDWVADQPNGKSKFLALSAVMNSIKNPVNVGLALFAKGSPTGGYIRSAPRDMSVVPTRTSFQNLLGVISADANSSKETPFVKDESAAFYEIYKFFSGMRPYAGSLAQNPNADALGNAGSYAGATAFSQGLGAPFAFNADGTYNSTATTCGKNYIIYIVANNSSGGPAGLRKYETTDAGAAILPAPGAPDTFADEWARFNFTNANPKIVTYVLDAYFPDDNQDAGYSQALQGIAKQGGGTYKHVRNQTEIMNELLRIFAEIQAVNSTFASASLPVSATNRAQNQNQVFIGMFRPDTVAKPRWFGNMKRYQLIDTGSAIELGDANGLPAVNPQTGFVTDCAQSFWTSDSSKYWLNVAVDPTPAGKCLVTSNDPMSDSPDGPFVEKGASAEVVRKGNNPPTTDSTPTFATKRTMYTLSGAALTSFTTASTGLTANLVNYISGQDVNLERTGAKATDARPSIHGDVVHSRPLPLNYGTAVTVYYGANDGTLRAVDAATGKEHWAFVAPETFGTLQRLMDNSPLVSFPNQPPGIAPAPLPKDYYFDGSIGAFQNADSSKVWIFPTMRRGGRMIYAFDVLNPTTPVFKWKSGCPNLLNDTGCTSGLAGIGQTWSAPNVAFIRGYSTTTPIMVIGGGYDKCEDADTDVPTCTGAKGSAVYVIDASDGHVIHTFPTSRSVIADVAMIDIDVNGFVDYAYAADTGGNLYRIDFIDGPTTRNFLSEPQWKISKVAHTTGAGRKFQYQPALFLNGSTVYVALGSGDREHPLAAQYPYSKVTNRFYVYADDLTLSADNNLDDTVAMADFTTTPSCTGTKILPQSKQKGWYLTLNKNGPGEQVVTSAAIVGGLVTFSTNRPIPQALGTCTTALGEARGYLLDLLTGSGAIGVKGICGGAPSSTFAGGGMPPSPVIGVVPIKGVPKTVLIGGIQKSGGASSGIQAQQVMPNITPTRKRVYWYPSGSD